MSSTYHFHLTEQHCVDDYDFLNFLNHIRHWVPTQSELKKIQADRDHSPDRVFISGRIIQMFQDPDITVLTFTNNAAQHINKSFETFLQIKALL